MRTGHGGGMAAERFMEHPSGDRFIEWSVVLDDPGPVGE